MIDEPLYTACPVLDSGRTVRTVHRRSPVAVAFGEGLGKPFASAKASAARGWRPMGVRGALAVI